ncbi:hypothetical protein BC830DRAFT_1135661 [Chytriomyces sp. MP71]|nr:hypothetical protein BC830DRAFT_1135661 [Chytriomyces sp. MP71]
MHLLAAAILCFAAVHAAYTDTAGNGFRYNGKQINATHAEICITATNIDTDTYVGFGIPSNASDPRMVKADLTVVWANASNVVMQLHGRGFLSDGPFFNPDSQSSLPTGEAASPSDSSYVGRVLTACFTRPITYSASQSTGFGYGNNLTIGSTSYLWSTGFVAGGQPLNHGGSYSSRGIAQDVNLFDNAVATGTSRGASASATATASATNRERVVKRYRA